MGIHLGQAPEMGNDNKEQHSKIKYSPSWNCLQACREDSKQPLQRIRHFPFRKCQMHKDIIGRQH